MAAPRTPAQGSGTGLEGYLRHVLFNQFLQNRLPLEFKWERNREDVKSITRLGDTWKKGEAEDWRSDTFISKSREKVMSAYSILLSVMMDRGKVPFQLKASPWDEFNARLLGEQADEKINDRIKDMQALIHQQILETHSDREIIKCFLSVVQYGLCFAKMRVQTIERPGFEPRSVAGIGPEGIPDEMISFRETMEKHKTMSTEYVSIWDIFRDIETNDLMAGVGVFQRSLITPFDALSRKGKPFYIDEKIDQVLASATPTGTSGIPTDRTATLKPSERRINFRQNTIHELEFWGRAPTDAVEEFEAQLAMIKKGKEPDPSQIDTVNAVRTGRDTEIMAVIQDGKIVRFDRTEPEERPFLMAVCEEDLDELTTQGIADNVQAGQKAFTGALRGIEDNVKLSGNVILGLKPELLEEVPGDIRPGMKITVSPEAERVSDAIQPIVIPDITGGLTNLLGIVSNMIDEASMIPQISQGIKPSGDPTLGQLTLQEQNASRYIGSITRNIDEGLIEPMITRYYRRNMNDPNVKHGKGNYIVEAQGFASFTNKVILARNLQRLLAIIQGSPEAASETDIRYILEQIIESLELDSSKALKSEEQKQEEAVARAEAEQNDVVRQMAIEAAATEILKARAEAAKLEAETRATEAEARNKTLATEADIRQKDEELEIDRAEAVADIEDKARSDDTK